MHPDCALGAESGNRMNCFIDNVLAKRIMPPAFPPRHAQKAARVGDPGVRGLTSAFVVYPQLALWARRISPASLACIYVCLVFLISIHAIALGKNALLNGGVPSKKRLRGRTPMDMIATETGGHLLEEALYQIDEGMAA